MDSKIIALMVVAVLTMMSEFSEAQIPEFCAVTPERIYRSRAAPKAWVFNADINKCEVIQSFGRHEAGNSNWFATEKKCLKTCHPDQAKNIVFNFNMVAEQCQCHCRNFKTDLNVQTTAKPFVTSPASVSKETVTVVPTITRHTTEGNFWSKVFG